MDQGNHRISLWKEDALAVAAFLFMLYVAPYLALSLEKAAP